MRDAECAINFTTYQTMYHSIGIKKRQTICLPQLPLTATNCKAKDTFFNIHLIVTYVFG